MDRNSIIGIFLIVAIFIGYNIYNSPSEEEIEAAKKAAIEKAEQDSIRRVKSFDESTNTEFVIPADTTEQFVVAQDSATSDLIVRAQLLAIQNKKYGIFSPSAPKDQNYDPIIVENEKIQAAISPLGGKIIWVKIKAYKNYREDPAKRDTVILFGGDSSTYYLNLDRYKPGLSTGELLFKADKKSFKVEGENSNSIKFRLNTSDPEKHITYTYHFKGNSYNVGFDINVVGLKDEVLAADELELEWMSRPPLREKGLQEERRHSSVYYRYFDEKRDYLAETGDDDEKLIAKTNWVAFKQDFFSTVLISDEGFLNGSGIRIKEINSDKYIKDYSANLFLSFRDRSDAYVPLTFYFGPNEYQTLKDFDNGMEYIIDLGWGIFGKMNQWVVIPLFNFLEKNLGIASYGIIILILTIIIKMILLPLTYRNYKSSAKMRALKPEIDALNEKFKDADPMKKQQAQMSLYRSTGVNPMAGCLPMLIQMPILYAMFRFFPSSIELRQKSFLWADDLSAYDSIANLGFQIPFYGDHVSLFTLLMAASTILYTRMNSSNMPSSGAAGMPNMKIMMYIFPVMMLFFFNSFSSALSYYYLTANVMSILQMFVIKKYMIDENKLRLQIEQYKKNPKKNKKSKFQQRLEEVQKQQRAVQNKRRR